MSESFSRNYYKTLKDAESHFSFLKKKASVLLPTLQLTEKKFFELIAFGHVESVREFLKDKPDFNINCTDFQVSTLKLQQYRAYF